MAKMVAGFGSVRKFESGATRDSDQGKLDYEGFLSPIVLERFAQYMHKHRVQADGGLRDSDNWQKGIPAEQYMKSLIRHVVEAWKYKRGDVVGAEPYQDTLCAIMFNVMGALLEDLGEGEVENVPSK